MAAPQYFSTHSRGKDEDESNHDTEEGYGAAVSLNVAVGARQAAGQNLQRSAGIFTLTQPFCEYREWPNKQVIIARERQP